MRSQVPSAVRLAGCEEIGVTCSRSPTAALGSLIDSDSLTAAETGTQQHPRENWPPVVIPFFAFRVMVGCGLVMLGSPGWAAI